MPYKLPSYDPDTDLPITDALVVFDYVLHLSGARKDRAAYRVYRNAAHFVAKPDKPCGVITVQFDINPSGINFILQANAALLLLPVMAGAVQV